MRNCNNCGELINEDMKYCHYCGYVQLPNNENEITAKEVKDQMRGVPYNETSKPGFLNSTKLVFRDKFVIDKRLGRADFLWSALVLASIQICLGYFGFLIFGITMVLAPILGVIVGICLALAMIFFGVVATTAYVRRLHDVNKSGLYFFITEIPIIGWAIVVYLACQKSVQMQNKWVKDGI